MSLASTTFLGSLHLEPLPPLEPVRVKRAPSRADRFGTGAAGVAKKVGGVVAKIGDATGTSKPIGHLASGAWTIGQGAVGLAWSLGAGVVNLGSKAISVVRPPKASPKAESASSEGRISKLISRIGKRHLNTLEDVSDDLKYISGFSGGGPAFAQFLKAIAPVLVDLLAKIEPNFSGTLHKKQKKEFCVAMEAALITVAANLIEGVQNVRKPKGLSTTVVDVLFYIGTLVEAKYKEHYPAILAAEKALADAKAKGASKEVLDKKTRERNEAIFPIFKPMIDLAFPNGHQDINLKMERQKTRGILSNRTTGFIQRLIWPELNSPTTFAFVFDFFMENRSVALQEEEQLKVTSSGRILLGLSKLLTHKITVEVLRQGCARESGTLAQDIGDLAAKSMSNLLYQPSEAEKKTFPTLMGNSLCELMMEFARREDAHIQAGWAYLANRINRLFTKAFLNLACSDAGKLESDPFTAAMHSLRTLFLDFYQTRTPAPEADEKYAIEEGSSMSTYLQKTGKAESYNPFLFEGLAKAFLEKTKLDGESILLLQEILSKEKPSWLSSLIQLLFRMQPELKNWIQPAETLDEQEKKIHASDRVAFRDLAKELSARTLSNILVPLLDPADSETATSEAETKAELSLDPHAVPISSDKETLAVSLGNACASGFVGWLSIPQAEAIALSTLQEICKSHSISIPESDSEQFKNVVKSIQVWISHPHVARMGILTINKICKYLQINPDLPKRNNMVLALSAQIESASYYSDVVPSFSAWFADSFRDAGRYHSTAIARKAVAFITERLKRCYACEFSRTYQLQIEKAIVPLLREWLLKRSDDPVTFALCPDLQSALTEEFEQPLVGQLVECHRELRKFLEELVAEADPYLETLWQFVERHVESTYLNIIVRLSDPANQTTIRKFIADFLASEQGRTIDSTYASIKKDQIETVFKPLVDNLLKWLKFEELHSKWALFNLSELVRSQLAHLLHKCYGEFLKPRKGTQLSYSRISTILYGNAALEVAREHSTDPFDPITNLKRFMTIFSGAHLSRAMNAYFTSGQMVGLLKSSFNIRATTQHLERFSEQFPIRETLTYHLNTLLPKVMANVCELLLNEGIQPKDVSLGEGPQLTSLPAKLVNKILTIVYRVHPKIKKIEDQILEAQHKVENLALETTATDPAYTQAEATLAHLKANRNQALDKLFLDIAQQLLYFVGDGFSVDNPRHPLYDIPFLSTETRQEWWKEHIPLLLAGGISSWYHTQDGVNVDSLETKLRTRYYNVSATLYNACLQRLETLKHRGEGNPTAESIAKEAERMFKTLIDNSKIFFEEMHKRKEDFARIMGLSVSEESNQKLERIFEQIIISTATNNRGIHSPEIRKVLLSVLVSTYRNFLDPRIDRSSYQGELANISAQKARSSLITWAATDQTLIPYLVDRFIEELDSIARDEENVSSSSHTPPPVSTARALHRFFTDSLHTHDGDTSFKDIFSEALTQSLNDFAYEAAADSNPVIQYALNLFEKWVNHYLEHMFGATAMGLATMQELDPKCLVNLATDILEIADVHARKLSELRNPSAMTLPQLCKSYQEVVLPPSDYTPQVDSSYKQLHPVYVEALKKCTPTSTQKEIEEEIEKAKMEYFYKPISADILAIAGVTAASLPIPPNLPESTKQTVFKWFQDVLCPALLRNLDKQSFSENTLKQTQVMLTKKMDQKFSIPSLKQEEKALRDALEKELAGDAARCGSIVKPIMDWTMASCVKFVANIFVDFDEISENVGMSLLSQVKQLSTTNDILAPLFKLSVECMHPGQWRQKAGTKTSWEYQPINIKGTTPKELERCEFPPIVPEDVQKKERKEAQQELVRNRAAATRDLKGLFNKIIHQSAINTLHAVIASILSGGDKLFNCIPLVNKLWDSGLTLLGLRLGLRTLVQGVLYLVFGILALVILPFYIPIRKCYASSTVSQVEEILALPINDSLRMQMMTYTVSEIKKAVQKAREAPQVDAAPAPVVSLPAVATVAAV